MICERVWIPMMSAKGKMTRGEVFRFYQAGPWAVTLPAARGRGFVVTHMPSGAIALPYSKNSDLDIKNAMSVVDALYKKISHVNNLTDRELNTIRPIVEDMNELRWET